MLSLLFYNYYYHHYCLTDGKMRVREGKSLAQGPQEVSGRTSTHGQSFWVWSPPHHTTYYCIFHYMWVFQSTVFVKPISQVRKISDQLIIKTEAVKYNWTHIRNLISIGLLNLHIGFLPERKNQNKWENSWLLLISVQEVIYKCCNWELNEKVSFSFLSFTHLFKHFWYILFLKVHAKHMKDKTIRYKCVLNYV